MLNLFVDHYVAWRQCTSDYADVSTDEAKIEFIRMRVDRPVPFLLKLSDEVQQAESCLLRHLMAVQWKDLYPDRRNLEFSRLSAILSHDEAEMLSLVHEQMGNHMQALLFDGGYVQCSSALVESRLRDTCRQCFEKFIMISIRSWPALVRDEPALSRHALRSSTSEVVSDSDWVYPYKNCLLNVVASLEPACDLSALDDQAEVLCAREFNDTMRNMSQRPVGENVGLVLAVIDHVESLLNQSDVWFCHEALPNGNGHWCGLGSMLAAIGHLSSSALSALCEEVVGLTWFKLAKASYHDALPMGAACELTGSIMLQARTPTL